MADYQALYRLPHTDLLTFRCLSAIDFSSSLMMRPVFTQEFLGHTLNQHQSSAFSISVVDYTEQVSEEWHFHEKVHISSILRGGNLESRKAGETQVNPGKIMLYNQGEIHRNRYTAHPSRNLNIEFEEHFFEGGLSLAHFRPDEKANMEFHQIYLELLLNDAYSSQGIEQIIQSLFWREEEERKGHWIPKLKTLLHDRWDEFPSLDELSIELAIHPVTLSKYFAQISGMTLSEYMRKIKVKRALELLLNSSDSLAEIALTCGFSDQSHMNRLVKRHTGYTPGIIRSLG